MGGVGETSLLSQDDSGFKSILKRGKEATSAPKAKDEFNKLLNALENAFISTGGGQGSRIGNLVSSIIQQQTALVPQLADLRREQLRSDPLLRRQRQLTSGLFETVASDLRGIQQGGLPADLRRTITEETRGALAARGIQESPAGAISEATRLIGGTEALRGQRLSQALAALSGGTQALPSIAPAQRAPGFETFLSGAFGTLPSLISTEAQRRVGVADQLRKSFTQLDVF